MAATCVFCGASPTTREHLWPDWARRLFPNERSDYLRRRGGDGRTAIEEHEFPIHLYDRTVKAVCADCNGGWMSAIETRAKPLLEPMLDGEDLRLAQADQEVLASWAVLKALMFDRASPEAERVFPQAEYSAMFARGRPSQTIRVWLASYAGGSPGASWVYGLDLDSSAPAPADRGERDLYGATITFGPVAVKVFGTAVSGLLRHASPLPSPIIHRIWQPSRRFSWRAAPGFDTANMELFAFSILSDCRPVAGPQLAPPD